MIYQHVAADRLQLHELVRIVCRVSSTAEPLYELWTDPDDIKLNEVVDVSADTGRGHGLDVRPG